MFARVALASAAWRAIFAPLGVWIKPAIVGGKWPVSPLRGSRCFADVLLLVFGGTLLPSAPTPLFSQR